VILDGQEKFTLGAEVRAHLRAQPSPFGFGCFSEAVFYRTYSRMKTDGCLESWGEVVIRAIEGVMSIRKWHYLRNRLPWDEGQMQSWAAEMATLMQQLRWLPPGRGLWALGTEHVARHGAAALCNCAAVHAEPLDKSLPWAMDMLMMGVGVGFDTFLQTRPIGALDQAVSRIVIADSREGWVDSVRSLVQAHLLGQPEPVFDYSLLRLKGARIKGFGGTASGPQPLKELHQRLSVVLKQAASGEISLTRLAADCFNAVARCVVAGNVRRSAQLALGCPGDEDFLKLKNPEHMAERQDIAWLSNNTLRISKELPDVGLEDILEQVRSNGEPGFFFLDQVQKYGRMGELSPDPATLCNPCAEIPLESMELCNLAEVFPSRCQGPRQLQRAIKAATFLAHTVSLLPTHSEWTNEIIARNRRIGVSLSGIADWMARDGWNSVRSQLRSMYGEVKRYATSLARESGVPAPIRLTTVKPSGTVSLLAGVSAGMHWPIARHAIRRMRVAAESPVADVLSRGGLPCEPDVTDPDTMVFEFPVQYRSLEVQSQVPVFAQLSLLAALQEDWSDNMVSATIHFDLEREGQLLASLLKHFSPKLKSVSFLPVTSSQIWPQMPIEAISEPDWHKRVHDIRSLDWSRLNVEVSEPENYCTKDTCQN